MARLIDTHTMWVFGTVLPISEFISARLPGTVPKPLTGDKQLWLILGNKVNIVLLNLLCLE